MVLNVSSQYRLTLFQIILCQIRLPKKMTLPKKSGNHSIFDFYFSIIDLIKSTRIGVYLATKTEDKFRKFNLLMNYSSF